MARAYLGLGSNIGDREEHLRFALAELSRVGTVLARASLVETDPVDCPAGGKFLNTCVCLDTALAPLRLLAAAMHIEQQRGRKRITRNEPRVLDIDILLYGELVLSEQDLEIPHPRLQERGFVLNPLAEIAPNLMHPCAKVSVRTLLAGLKIAGEGGVP
ncbi:MAG: 2-amino-4-hydroxy-6-hydroxymethyldihydropteridine diphosphokinase [Bryobacterales bacterium]|nr:2-amino-4-hydroxy-6-hydroxymethyldihydropteridine diphosphokinase [Bryobacterales bacterium]